MAHQLELAKEREKLLRGEVAALQKQLEDFTIRSKGDASSISQLQREISDLKNQIKSLQEQLAETG